MSAQEIEFTEEDFLIYELRHEELIEELKNIITLLSKEDDDSEEGLLLSTISTQTNEISKLVKLIEAIFPRKRREFTKIQIRMHPSSLVMKHR